MPTGLGSRPTFSCSHPRGSRYIFICKTVEDRQPAPRHAEARLLHRDQIKLAERLLIKERPFLGIATAPVFVTARNSHEIARADALGTCIVSVEVGAT